MNLQAHMSGQISGQVPNQSGSQLSSLPQQHGTSLPSQIQNPRNPSMDAELDAARATMREKIYNCLERRNHSSGDWQRRLPELAKRLEDRIFKEASTKNDYLNMVMEPVEHLLQSVLRNLPHNSQSVSHHITPSSAFSTMIPTPGITQNSSGNPSISCAMENSTIATSGAGLPQSTNIGNFPGSISNAYQHTSANSAGSNVASSMASMGLPRQSTQMIPTPGLNSKDVSMHPEYSNGAGFFSAEGSMIPQTQQQKQYVGSQSSHIYLGGQIATGMRSNVQQKPSAYGFPNGLMNGGIGLLGNNIQMANGPPASEGYMSTAPYNSSQKPLQQRFNQQHAQQRIPTSFSQQVMPISGDGYSVKPADIAGSGSFYGPGSSVLPSISNPNVNTTNIESNSRTNPSLLTHQSNMQTMQLQPHMRSQMFDHPEKVNFQPLQSTQEHLLPPQQAMQQPQQQPNQPYTQFVQNQHHLQQQQQNQKHQQLLFKGSTLRQSSVSSSLAQQLIPENAVPSHNELALSQATSQVQLPELQGQYLQKTSYDNAKGGQLVGQLSGSQNFNVSGSQDSQQLLHPYQQSDESQNEINCLPTGSQPHALLQAQWRPQLLEKTHMTDNSSIERQIQEELHQRTTGQDEAQQPCLSLDGCISRSPAAAISASAPNFAVGIAKGPEQSPQQSNYYNQLRLLLLLHHARSCPASPGNCPERSCIKAQQLVRHISNCSRKQCVYRYCLDSRKVLLHYRDCCTANCPVCSRARKYLFSQKAFARALPEPGTVAQQNGSWKTIKGTEVDMETDALPIETSDDRPSLPKRMRVPVSLPLVPESEFSPVLVPSTNPSHSSQEAYPEKVEESMMALSVKPEVIEVKSDPALFAQENPVVSGYGIDRNVRVARVEMDTGVSNDVGCLVTTNVKQETMVAEKEIKENKNIEVKQDSTDSVTDPATGSKSGKPKIKGVSLTELFTPEQIREHIISLRQWVGQSKAKAEKNQAMERSMSENSCQLCAVEKLTFEPPPIYCSPCGARIKRNAMYYTIGSGETRHYFCIPCYNEARGDTIEAEGVPFQKTKLEKKKNDEEIEEWWVQCDKCEAWQHQICALFNGRRNDGGQAEYTCPNCYIEEIERGERKPLPQNAVLGAKDLPRTILSDHIEQRLLKRLKIERQERANHFGKSFDEVPGADGLVVRVVSSVDKKLEVKPRFLEIFQEDNYPTEFPYKSKAVLLFQRIEGVEVCLFGMYVQEFGSECAFPNQRRVYLSYLDSVKYFRPEIRTTSGEALRTFVYHEILIGYLEYCKNRGFTSCYIWACPPLKGEDYILYCHPEIQKTPKSDKLREWYLAMLRKASKENIVVDLTNLYDHFFTIIGECKAKVTAARLPYFDGDYWPGAAEDMINQLRQEEDDRKHQKKGKTKKIITKRALKAAGQADLSGNASKDALLMQKLGETIYPMKEDFIMVHLQHACTHCCLLMVSGTRWVCNQCKNFQLCDKCHDADQRREERDRHPINSREKHMLYPVEIDDVPLDTKDKDEILESEFFDTRQAFLSLCQGNHYQYDTLRRAKHSSMMVLYHLHNPTAPAFVTTCNVCHHDIETGQGWRCEVCPEFDVCNACYQKEGGINHPHKLTNHPSNADRDAQNKEARQKRVLQLRKMLDLLVHASKCRFPHCQYPNCRKVKGLFRHGIQCKVRVPGGCVLCKKMWYILQLHARACKESECSVPRCRDLKEHLRRLQHQSDSRRRAAVMEMMRQRAAEVAGNTE
ncbi:probable histone acetyltransferase HAC-like 1 [Typha angustifolia]|uniref:probable histone acetyltransferase HAC-like 1 n=1 Tax=Typha angustifolia TaxID=59011 RepID=UPI003C2C84C1